MILRYRKPGKEGPMHSLTATTLYTESGKIQFVECEVCGPLGIVPGEDAWGYMLDHVKEMAQ
jgi:hypothetical protein